MMSLKQISQGTVYDKNHRLGKGSFGQVYLGFHEKSKSPVAVKIISLQKLAVKQANYERLQENIKRQIVNLQIGQNQHLVKLEEINKSKKKQNFYLVCQFCNGDSFDKYLKAKGTLTQNEALRFLKDIVIGFQILNLKNIVHRDLKPANILMHNYSLKIADLGFSKLIENHEQMLDSLVGSPFYMSPQIYRREKYTQKTDIWSLGIILFEMLYGRGPWKIRSQIDYKTLIQTEPVQFPAQPIVTNSTKKLIKSMLQVPESDRIGWQYLFDNFGNFKGQAYFSTVQKSTSKSLKRISYHFTGFRVIESPFQIPRVLQELEVATKEQLDSYNHPQYENHQIFFKTKQYLKQKQSIINKITNYYLQRRNRISFYINVFCAVLDVLEEGKIEKYEILLHRLMFFIIKFVQSSLFRLLKTNDMKWTPQQIAIFQKSPHQKPLLKLLEAHNDVLQEFLIQYLKSFYSQIERLNQKWPCQIKELNKQIGGFYNEQPPQYNITKFMLEMTIRRVFNEIKSKANISERICRLARYLHQYNRNKNLFVIQQKQQKLAFSLTKRYELWDQDFRWNSRAAQLKTLQVQSLYEYLNKKIHSSYMESMIAQ